MFNPSQNHLEIWVIFGAPCPVTNCTVWLSTLEIESRNQKENAINIVKWNWSQECPPPVWVAKEGSGGGQVAGSGGVLGIHVHNVNDK